MTDITSEQVLEMENLRDQLVSAGWITEYFDKASQKPKFLTTDEGLKLLVAYQYLTDDLVLNIGTKESLIPVSWKVWESMRKTVDPLDVAKLEPFIIKHADQETNSSIFLPKPVGHELFYAMVFWCSDKLQKEFHKNLRTAEIKMKVKNWVAKEASPRAILGNMMKASIKMGEVSDGLAKFAGETKPPKKRKWSGQKRKKKR